MPVTAANRVPIVDVGPLVRASSDAERSAVARALNTACCGSGFFYAVDHGVPHELVERLERLSRQFFAQDPDTKMRIRMALAGRAWRGYFPVGDELTSGKPDQKEGLYFGAELPADDPRVQRGVPLHGPNLFPDLPGFRETVLEYLDQLTNLGHALMRGMALSLDLEPTYFQDRYTANPLILFRIFNYPSAAAQAQDGDTWGVGEHTDYGLLTILKQDDVGGLQVRGPDDTWIDAPPIPGSFACNIGDMLERLTGGLYTSNPHRVRNRSTTRDRLSFPFFFDPDFDAEVRPIEGLPTVAPARLERWDHANPHAFSGTYGDYVLSKVGKVFPDLGREVFTS